MIKVKASTVTTVLRWREKKFGRQSLEKVLAALAPEDRDLLTSPNLLPSQWIPIDVYTAYLDAVINVFYGGDKNKFTKQAEDAVLDHLNTIYRSLIKIGPPHFIIGILSSYLKTYFQGVEIEIKSSSPRQYEIVLKGFDKKNSAVELSIIAWVRTVFTLNGAKNLKAVIIESISLGSGRCVMAIAWD